MGVFDYFFSQDQMNDIIVESFANFLTYINLLKYRQLNR